jgi:hypothetical protein
MTEKPKSWSIQHFAQAAPKDRQGDVPRLLRSVADTIERLGPVEVQDLILGTEVNEHGPWYHLTVYFHTKEDRA